MKEIDWDSIAEIFYEYYSDPFRPFWKELPEIEKRKWIGGVKDVQAELIKRGFKIVSAE